MIWLVNKIADKITSVSKKKSTKALPNDETEEDVEIAIPKKKIHIPRRKIANYYWIKISTKKGCIFLEIIDELMLTLKRYISLKER